MTGSNRVLVGLPERLASAREQIRKFEERDRLIEGVILTTDLDDSSKLRTIWALVQDGNA